jgi:hypothetical protein
MRSNLKVRKLAQAVINTADGEVRCGRGPQNAVELGIKA